MVDINHARLHQFPVKTPFVQENLNRFCMTILACALPSRWDKNT